MKNRVKRHRLLKEYTQSELSKAIGVSRQTIHAIEAGKYVPSTELALRLAKEFAVPVEELFQLD